MTTKEKTHVVQFEGWANNKETEMKVKFGDKTTETLEIIEDVVWTGLAKSELRGKDIIKIIVTDDDNKDIKKVEILIAANDSANDVWEVVTVSRDRLTLKDANKDSRTFYLKDAEEFAYNTTAVLSTADRVKIAQDGTSDYLDAVLVVNPKWEVSANKGTAPTTATGVVTAKTPTGIEVDNKDVYILNDNTIVRYNGRLVASGATQANTTIQLGDQVKVEGSIITITKSASFEAAATSDANAFKTTHSAILAETVSTIAIGDQTALSAAVTAYNALTSEAKALLTAEKTLLDNLQDKIDDLVAAQAQADANSFKTTYATELGRTLATVANGDNIAAAISAYNALTAEAKALLTSEIALLNNLEAREDAIAAVQAAQGGTRAAMKAAIEDADLGLDLTAYNGLMGAQKDLAIDALLALSTTYTNTASVQADLDAQL